MIRWLALIPNLKLVNWSMSYKPCGKIDLDSALVEKSDLPNVSAEDGARNCCKTSRHHCVDLGHEGENVISTMFYV